MDIYSVTICGDKFYFYGNLSEEECDIINHVCNDLSLQSGGKEGSDLFEEFIFNSNKLLRDKIFRIKIKQVFRIDKG